MRASLVLALFLSGATGIRAQSTGSLRGRVVDAGSGVALAGADFSVDGASTRVRSAGDGSFRVDHVATGRHILRVRRIGYASRADAVDVSSDSTTITLALTPSALELDALVVTAARRAQKLKDVVSTTEVVNRQDIGETGANNIESVLSEQVGVQFTNGIPSGASVSLQGLSNQRVLVLVDGLPLYGNIAGALDLSRIPASVVERVEVVKGPQSTLYGSEAMGGVINVITRRADAMGVNLDVRQTVGSDRRSDSDVFGTFRNGHISGTTSFGHQYATRTAGIASTSGALTDRLSGTTSLRWLANDVLGFNASALVLNDRERWPNGSLFQFADNTQLDARIGSEYTRGETSLSSSLSISQLDHLSRSSRFDEPIRGTGDRQKQRLEQGDLVFSRRAGPAVLDGGISARREFISTSDGRIPGGSRTLDSADPYVQLDVSNDRWSLVPGARLSWSEHWGTYVSPKLAARFRPMPTLTLRASVGRGYRAPDFKELYLDFTNNAAFYAVHGNAALRPESSDNASAGVEWDGSRMYARTSFFANRLRDFIETVPLASSGNFAQYTYLNVAQGSTRGAELSTGTTIGLTRIEGGYAYLHTLDNSTGGPLPGQAGNSARLMLSTPVGESTRLVVTEILTARTPMAIDASGIVTDYRDAFARLDARIARPLLRRYALSAGVDNMLDARPARWADGTGRQFYLTLGWQLHPDT